MKRWLVVVRMINNKKIKKNQQEDEGKGKIKKTENEWQDKEENRMKWMHDKEDREKKMNREPEKQKLTKMHKMKLIEKKKLKKMKEERRRNSTKLLKVKPKSL